MSDRPPTPRTLELPKGDRVAAAKPDAPGELIGRFEITGKLGEGGMGVVFAGRDPDLGRRVAIKVLQSAIDRPGYRERLLREARAMALIDHPNVVQIYEVGSDRERLFVAMELVEGTTLAAWLRAEERPWQAIIAMFAQAGRGLAAVHRAGIVHRDFKPENVLVDRAARARVADFGLARFDDEYALESLTRTGMRLGTPGYMAPEQIAGSVVDARADQYAFCVALREALLRWPATGEPANWRDIPQPIRDAVTRGLAHVPAERFATMEDLLAALGVAPKRRWIVPAMFVAGVVAAGGATFAMMDRSPAAMPITSIAADAKLVDAALVVVADLPPDAPADAPVDATPKHHAEKPPAPAGTHEMDASHRPSVRFALRTLGRHGVKLGDDHAADLVELQTKDKTKLPPTVRGQLLFGIGLLERLTGNCKAAAIDLGASISQLAAVTMTDSVRLFIARSRFNLALCDLETGHAIDADRTLAANRDHFQVPAPEAEIAEVHFAMGIAKAEIGDEVHGRELLIIAGRHSVELQNAIETYARAIGMKL